MPLFTRATTMSPRASLTMDWQQPIRHKHNVFVHDVNAMIRSVITMADVTSPTLCHGFGVTLEFTY